MSYVQYDNEAMVRENLHIQCIMNFNQQCIVYTVHFAALTASCIYSVRHTTTATHTYT